MDLTVWGVEIEKSSSTPDERGRAHGFSPNRSRAASHHCGPYTCDFQKDRLDV